MAIGLPGSGKTTLLKKAAKRYDLTYISRDDIREEMLGDALVQSANKQVWQEANRKTIAALKSGRGVVLDSCFVEAWKRKDAIALLRESGADRVIAVFFNVSIEISKERNLKRKYVVPNRAIDWMYERLKEHPPSKDEGFDALYTVDKTEEFERMELAHG